MSTEMELLEQNDEKSVRLYDRMCEAIAACHSIDEVRETAKHAEAIAAYYREILDVETERKFLQVKLRAWRRIGEELIEHVNLHEHDTMAARIRAVRASFGDDPTVAAMSDSMIRQAIRISYDNVPDDAFERAILFSRSIDQVLSFYEREKREAWEASPEGQAELKAREEHAKRSGAEWAEREKEREKRDAEAAAQLLAEQREFHDFRAARDEAFTEVGLTLERREREQMKQVVFLIKDQIHEVLRQAAFDKHVTMQEILRRGLAMWFIANGYNIPMTEMDVRPRKR